MTIAFYHVAKNPKLNLSFREIIYYNYSVSLISVMVFFIVFAVYEAVAYQLP